MHDQDPIQATSRRDGGLLVRTTWRVRWSPRCGDLEGRSVRVIVESTIRACGCSPRAVKLRPERSTEGCCAVRDPGRCSAAECRAARPWGGAGAGAPDRPIVDVAPADGARDADRRGAAPPAHRVDLRGAPGIRDGIRSSAMASSRVGPTPPSMILGTSTRLSRGRCSHSARRKGSAQPAGACRCSDRARPGTRVRASSPPGVPGPVRGRSSISDHDQYE